MTKLKGKSVLLTGGGSGIGLASARVLLDEGANVAIAGRDRAKLEKAARDLNSPRLHFLAADIGDPEQVRALVDDVCARFGQIDILINNAGLNVKNRALAALDPQTWQQLIRANLDGAFHCIHYVLPAMRQRRDGVIININSVAGKRGLMLSGAGYCAAKFGMDALATCLAAEVKDDRIRVSTIYPGEVDTPILDHRPDPVSAERRALFLRPEDVAEAVRFVATLPPHVTIPELIIKPVTQVHV